MLVAAAGFTSCDDDFEQAPLEEFIPHATMKPNTTLQELKEAFHQDVNFYSTEVGTKADGEHYIVSGRIVSSDEAGNIFKKIAIEDETGGAIFSINASGLYETYRYGQMVVVDVTGMWYGNYGAGVQIGGKPAADPATQAPSPMAESIWSAQAQTDGLANTDKITIYDLTVTEALELHNDPAELLRWQGRLVRITDVRFETPGKELAVSGQTNNTSYIIGDGNKKLAINTSGYSTFWSTKAPKGTGSVLAVLTNYTSGWQLQLNNIDGLEGFTPWSDEPEQEPDPVGSLDIDFEDGQIPEGWGNIQISGDKAWYVPKPFDNNTYVAMTGYKGTAPFDSWLVSQPLDASLMTAKTLTFDTQVNGYKSTTSALEVYILDNADPAKANKTKLDPALAEAPADGYSSWKASGSINLASVKGKFYIGWRYTATTDANYATWCVDNIKVQ